MSMPMSDTSDEQSQAFWRATEAALDVNDRYQFFVWMRLHLHRFIPHDLALCMMGGSPEEGADGAHVQVFHSVPVVETLLRDFPNARSRWWHDIAERWQRQGRRAVQIPLDDSTCATRESAALREDGYGTLLVHGFEAPSGEAPTPSLFVFALRASTDATQAALAGAHMNLWLPMLYCTAVRALPLRSPQFASEAAPPRVPAVAGEPETPLTKREIQILAAVREARQNAEIGRALGISALTVKNHLRSIMKKLNARNRAQAVAEAMSRRLIT